MSFADANGYLSWLLNVAGNLMLAWKWRSGWAVRIVAITAWGIYGIQISSKPIIANAVTFFLVNCYGWREWTKQEAKRKADELKKQKDEEWFETQRRLA